MVKGDLEPDILEDMKIFLTAKRTRSGGMSRRAPFLSESGAEGGVIKKRRTSCFESPAITSHINFSHSVVAVLLSREASV